MARYGYSTALSLEAKQESEQAREIATDAILAGRMPEAWTILANARTHLTKPQAKRVAKLLAADGRKDDAITVLTRVMGKESAERELAPMPTATVGDLLYAGRGYDMVSAVRGRFIGEPKRVRVQKACRGTDTDMRAKDASGKRQRIATVKETKPQVLIGTPEDCARVVRPLFNPDQETCVVVCVNVRNCLIDAHVVAIGTVHSVEVHPRDVFRHAIRCNAAWIVVAHNHPSGDPTPSQEDVTLTRRLQQAGELLGIPLVDHVVVTTDSHRSITETMGASL
jgi:DNA repair protein RadC